MVFAPFGRRACLIVVLGMITTSAFAQGTSTAIIAGVVRDTSGAVLPGVTIEAASPALIEKIRSTITDDRGEYRLPELRPGMYTVTFSLAGFSTVRREGLELRTNFTAQVDVELKVSQLEETITVSGATPLVDAGAPILSLATLHDGLLAVGTSEGLLVVRRNPARLVTSRRALPDIEAGVLVRTHLVALLHRSLYDSRM